MSAIDIFGEHRCVRMELITVLLLAVGLAMDAFAVSICKGLAVRKVTIRIMVIVGLWFGVFQGVMPVIGYVAGSAFYDLISEYDHWIAFILLFLIGSNMIREALSDEDEGVDDNLGFRTMLLLAIATSIDALAVGISLAMTGDGIVEPALIIGVVTMIISMFGVWIGSRFGDRYGKKAELVGGVILILIGLRIVLEHTGFI
ncbi:MAG: manganese efflux pump MntP family protein [Candidatus Methanomethylophilaceae archaeon]|nr:manganese efflux pump MntP family protein [Candidatus Methanomethylophilaceae archaeon]